MITYKEIKFRVDKPINYNPISKLEKRRVTRLVMRELLSVAGRFDGASRMKVTFVARGNL